MAIYAISDLHLSLGKPKPMDIFGPVWVDHAEKIRANWETTVGSEDTVLIPGDVSWAIRLSEAKPDLGFIARLPGRKVLVRGNHDYWWQRQATARIQRAIDRGMEFLQGTAVVIGNVGITGTRGWRIDWEMGEGAGDARSDEETHSEKILRRELGYLERGLQAIPDTVGLRIAMLHYPPFDVHLQPNEFAEMLARYSVDVLVYGHVHLGIGNWVNGEVLGVQYRLVSADVVDFAPQLIVP